VGARCRGWPFPQFTTSDPAISNLPGGSLDVYTDDVSQQLSPGAETIVDERVAEREDLRLEEGDHERFSHYVPKEKLTEAMVMGTPVVALCGKVWVPSRDPERFPVCPECKEIWASLAAGDDQE
jgi:hypothetical protein